MMEPQFDALANPYSMPRKPIYSKRAMVATSQPTAAQAGITILQNGGNAVDAAIASAAVLTVVEPTSNGIGGDAFALVWMHGRLHGLNSSGPSPRSITLDAVRGRGHLSMPRFGWEPVTVPGIPAAWAALAKRFGNLPLTETLKPAIRLAKEGYAVPPTLSALWDEAYRELHHLAGDLQYKAWFDTFAAKGRAPRTGELWHSEDHAKTLESIAHTDARSFYEGALAEQIDRFSRACGGFLSIDDLAAYSPEWVDPISADYRGYDVWEIPPNGQGLSALLSLQILKRFAPADRSDELSFHRMIEATKLAMTDGRHYITDARIMQMPVDRLLSESYAQQRAGQITDRAMIPLPGTPSHGGTVYLATADGEGNMVSYIQSNYEGFGSALVVPGTGIALQNRGCNFSLDPQHVNCLEPGKRTFHTIIPGFLSKGGLPVGPFGVMGGFNQPQGHVQAIVNSIDCHLHPQAALDAPRWRWLEDTSVLVEQHFPRSIADALSRRGHDVTVSADPSMFGRGQIIWRDPETGVLVGGTESRTDSMIAVL